MLVERKCSCKYFDEIKIFCGYVMIVVDGVGVFYNILCGYWYKIISWREIYEGDINLDGDSRNVEIFEEVSSMILYFSNIKR